MDLGALIIIVASGATVDALADINQGKEVVVTLIAASILLLVLSAVGRATGQYGLVSAVAFLYLLSSVFKNYQHVPMLMELVHGSASAPTAPTVTGSANPSAPGSPVGYSSAPAAGRLGLN
jgi:hypothetical protein